MKKYINLAIFIAFAILIVWVGLLRYKVKRLQEKPPTEVIIRDTIRDTIKIPKPVPVLVEVVEPFIVPVQELVFVGNGDSIVIPKTKKTYQDKNYKAIVSGYNPNLDYIEVYQETINNTIRIPAPKWSIGITAGYGAFYNKGVIRTGPGIMAGVSYRF